MARRLFLDEHKNAVEIAGLLKLPPALVRRQLFDSLLGPDVAEPKNGDGGRAAKPDQSQIDAREMRAGRNGLAYDAEADREEPGTATRLLVGLDDACEGELVAKEIIRLREAGVRLGNQAVLAPRRIKPS